MCRACVNRSKGEKVQSKEDDELQITTRTQKQTIFVLKMMKSLALFSFLASIYTIKTKVFSFGLGVRLFLGIFSCVLRKYLFIDTTDTRHKTKIIHVLPPEVI